MRFAVTPYAGVWIEIWILSNMSLEKWVTPYAGVWIEIDKICVYAHLSKSLPTRECGLKLLNTAAVIVEQSHSLRGSVD